MDPEHPDISGEPKCYRFKLNGFPFTIGGSKESSTAVRRMATNMLFNLYNIGWKVSIILFKYAISNVHRFGLYLLYWVSLVSVSMFDNIMEPKKLISN